MIVQIPYNFTPRDYQLPALQALDGGKKRVVAVWHRRAGKEKTFLNFAIKSACQRIGTYYYFFPTYGQGRKILWDGRDKDGFAFIDHFPQSIVSARNTTDMKVTLVNGSIVQIVGTDNIDSVVGTNPIGCVFSEYAVQDPRAWDYMRPILRENGGWAVFDYTPRGKNHGWDIYKMAKGNPDWFVSLLTVNDTGVISPSDIDAERREGMDEDLIQQEYYCSFEGARQGAYYAQQLKKAEEEGRICSVPYEPIVGVETWWDLGVADSTTIWFTQTVGREVRVIDYYEASGEGLSHYAKILKDRDYVYLQHHAPHDIEVRELGSGRSRREIASGLGIKFRLVPNISVMDGIEALRSFLYKCWFDRVKCERGLNALWSYHKDYDERLKTYRSSPLHDWSSHAADAARYMAVGHKDDRPKIDKPRIRRPQSPTSTQSWLGT